MDIHALTTQDVAAFFDFGGLFGGLIALLLVQGLFWLVLRVFSVRNFDLGFKFRNAPPEARQLACLSAALVALMAGTVFGLLPVGLLGLLILARTTAPLPPLGSGVWGSMFLVLGIVYLVRGLRSKPEQKP